MLEIFQYDFMRKALIVGILLAIIVPCIGVVVVLKRLSMVGDALAHTSLAGVALGLILNISPMVAAVIVCMLAAFSIEAIRKKLPRYSEISISIIMSVGIGLAGVLSGFVKDTSEFNSFLFGSIVSITDTEVIMVAIISVIVILTFLLLYKELMHLVFDEESARLSGIPVRKVNFIITILTAVTVSVAAKSVGTLVVSSLMVIPVACAMQIAKSYKQTVILSVVFGLIFTISGLVLSFYCSGLKPGGTIVLIGAAVLIPLLFVNKNK